MEKTVDRREKIMEIRMVAVNLMAYIDEHCRRTGHYPAIILAEAEAYNCLCGTAVHTKDGEEKWRGIPVRRISHDGMGIYLSDGPIRYFAVDECYPELTVCKEGMG